MAEKPKTKRSLARLRQEYSQAGLLEPEMAATPFDQFDRWFEDASEAGLLEVNSMSLATCSPVGLPSVRTVLLKGYSEKGFDFYTNYESRKGRDLEHLPRAAALFFWKELERQIVLHGIVEKVHRDETEDYFQQRPYGARIGAWVSNQSQEIPNREWLEERDQEFRAKYPEKEPVPAPPHWGGYRLIPLDFEFWQGRPNRLHDRIEYSRPTKVSEDWTMRRLSP